MFDTHTHAFPDAIAGRAVDTLTERAGIPHYHDGSFDALCRFEALADRFLLLPIATRPSQTQSVNRWAAERMSEKMLSFGSVHPESTNLRQELDSIAELGLLGIKFHPEYQQFFVDDPRWFPLYEEIFARGLLLCFHAGVDLGFPPPLHGAAHRIARVCDAFPKERIIAAHMGGYLQLSDAREYLAGRENLWMDTAYVADEIAPDDLVSLSRKHGVDRILFATDAPWKKVDVMLDAVIDAGFTGEELKGILYDNAARLLGVEDAR